MLDKMKDEVDLDVLDQIIKLAESAMVRPFNKKKEEEAPIEASGEADEGEMLEDSPESDDDDDLSDEDLDALMESYKRG